MFHQFQQEKWKRHVNQCYKVTYNFNLNDNSSLLVTTAVDPRRLFVSRLKSKRTFATGERRLNVVTPPHLQTVQNHNSQLSFIQTTFLVSILLLKRKKKTVPSDNKQQYLANDELVAENKVFFSTTQNLSTRVNEKDSKYLHIASFARNMF